MKTVKAKLWCCACKARPLDILFHHPTTGRAMLMAGSMFYGTTTPIFALSKASAKMYADEWNASMDNEPSLRVVPQRILITIELDDGKEAGR